MIAAVNPVQLLAVKVEAAAESWFRMPIVTEAADQPLQIMDRDFPLAIRGRDYAKLQNPAVTSKAQSFTDTLFSLL